ncbi:MAG: type II/IV secretion system protein [Candidatus Sungbacteria bacterium]|nr:type II/IV secretion system protein [Candidatus Sungbacteria bacterium]
MPQFKEDSVARKLELLRRKEEEENVKTLSQKYKLPYADLTAFPIEIDAIKVISEEKARDGELAVFQIAGKRLNIAVRNPDKNSTAAILKRLAEDRYEYELYLVSRSGLERAWSFYKRVPAEQGTMPGAIEVSPERMAAFQKEINTVAQIQKKIAGVLFAKTTEILEILLAGAISVGASDVHLEPLEDAVRIRFRIDGVLSDVSAIPPKPYALLLSRIKLVSELKLNVHNRSQDGRFTIKTDGTDIEVRTSTLPGPYGENTVLRVLHPQAIQVPFGDLGMQPWVIKTLTAELKRPNGMILTTGPTGSGKTTTLYAFLRKIHTPAIKVITIEDPIEYHLAGIEQTQVDPEAGYDFANGLRSIVRQDPDVILVGEIRDLETAETAMHAALTGHLVFSTLHTNDAAGTIPRLLDLGVKPNILAPAINVAMAQRLVRKLCAECRVPAELGAAKKKEIASELTALPKGITAPAQDKWTIFKTNPRGCASCSGLGYKKQIGVFEIILIDDGLETLILKDAPESEIKKAAERQGQITMRQDGLLKVLSGITDFAELERVLGVS